MGVASGCGEQEVGVASGSGWNLWVWLVGVIVRRYIDFLILGCKANKRRVSNRRRGRGTYARTYIRRDDLWPRAFYHSIATVQEAGMYCVNEASRSSLL